MTTRSRGPGLQPRIVRFRDAPGYVGMDRNRFNAEVRPFLVEVPIGAQGIGFDRLELDRWVDEYIARNGRPAQNGVELWDANNRQASGSVRGSGTSKSKSKDGAFTAALERAGLTKRKRSLRG